VKHNKNSFKYILFLKRTKGILAHKRFNIKRYLSKKECLLIKVFFNGQKFLYDLIFALQFGKIKK